MEQMGVISNGHDEPCWHFHGVKFHERASGQNELKNTGLQCVMIVYPIRQCIGKTPCEL